MSPVLLAALLLAPSAAPPVVDESAPLIRVDIILAQVPCDDWMSLDNCSARYAEYLGVWRKSSHSHLDGVLAANQCGAFITFIESRPPTERTKILDQQNWVVESDHSWGFGFCGEETPFLDVVASALVRRSVRLKVDAKVLEVQPDQPPTGRRGQNEWSRCKPISLS